MTDQKTEQKPEHEKRIREALEAGPTEGPFEVVRDGTYSYDIKTTDGYIVATTHGYVGDQVTSRPMANFIAACEPAAIRALLADLDAMRGALEKIAKADNSESGCYYTNRAHINIARAALKGASHE